MLGQGLGPGFNAQIEDAQLAVKLLDEDTLKQAFNENWSQRSSGPGPCLR
jgi:hypothetical protein